MPMETTISRFGVLGGTFNPIHNGHIQMAKEAKRALSLDAVLLMTAKQPPHKTVAGAVSSRHRYQMTVLTANEQAGILPCDMELERAGKSYTFETVQALRAAYPGAVPYWIIGGDMLFDLPNWYRAAELMGAVRFICFPRQSEQHREAMEAARLTQVYGASIQLMPEAVQQVSSTQIRERVRDGRCVTGLLPARVQRYVYEEGLYLPPDVASMQEKCRAMLKESRYKHTVGVIMTAAALAEQNGIDPEQARLAALLHDCGRGEDASPLGHADTSARLAAELFGVTDEAVLRAIRCHTVAAKGMQPLDQLIYLADMIEPGREYPGVEELRSLAAADLHAAYKAGLMQTIRYVRENGLPLHENSVLALAEAEKE